MWIMGTLRHLQKGKESSNDKMRQLCFIMSAWSLGETKESQPVGEADAWAGISECHGEDSSRGYTPQFEWKWFERLGRLTEGVSGSDITVSFKAALLGPVRQSLLTQQFQFIGDILLPCEQYDCSYCPTKLPTDHPHKDVAQDECKYVMSRQKSWRHETFLLVCIGEVGMVRRVNKADWPGGSMRMLSMICLNWNELELAKNYTCKMAICWME